MHVKQGHESRLKNALKGYMLGIIATALQKQGRSSAVWRNLQKRQGLDFYVTFETAATYHTFDLFYTWSSSLF
jgi:hypothetical protein